MIAINVAALQTIILGIVDLLTIGLICWGVWEITVNRSVGGFLSRAVTAIALFSIFNAVVPQMLGTPPVSGGDSVSAKTLYDNSVGLILNKVPGMVGQTTYPGLSLIEKGVSISQAIWSGIVTSKLIFLPIAWCLITWAIEIARGAGWMAIGTKLLFLTLLLAIVAGPVNRGLPAEVFRITSSVVGAVCTAIVTPKADPPKDEQGKPQQWTKMLVGLASNNAKTPTGLTSLTAPYIGSCERSMNATNLGQLQGANYLGRAADSLVANLWFVSQGPEADPKEFLNLATPIENRYDLLFTELEANEFVRRHYMDSDNTVFDAAKSKVGYIKIGATANPTDIIAEEYNRQRTQFIDKLKETNKQLLATNGNPDIISANTQRIAAAGNYKPPTVLPVSTIPALSKVRAFVDKYTEMTLRYKSDVIPKFEALDPDAWTILWLTPEGRTELGKITETPPTSADGTASGPGKVSFPTDDYYRDWAGNESILNAMGRNEQSATTQEPSMSIWNIWQTIKSLIAMFFVALAEGGMALTMLVLKLIVLLLAPLALYAGLFMVSVGIFICCCAYPIAAFMSLFPGRWAILLDWTKGVMWCMTWIPIMLVGMSLCEFSVDDIHACISAVIGAIPGFAAYKSAAVSGVAGGASLTTLFPNFPTEYMQPGLVTTSFISTVVGIFLICASPMVANLVFNPGIAGISSLTTSIISQVAGKVAGAAAAPLLAAGAGAAAGMKAAAAGASKLTQADQAKKLANTGGIQRTAAAGSGVSGGAGLKSIAKTLGGSSADIEGISKAASATESVSFGSKVASALATGATAGAQTMGNALANQAKRQIQGLKSMVSPEGITPAAARFSQAAAAAVRGDLLGAESFAKGHGEHTSDSDFVGKGGGGGRGEAPATADKPGAGTVRPAKGHRPEVASAIQRMQGAQAAKEQLAHGANSPEASRAQQMKNLHERGVEANEATRDGNLTAASNRAFGSMEAGLMGGHTAHAGLAAAKFLKKYDEEKSQGQAEGKTVADRSMESGMADHAMGAHRQEVESQAKSRGIDIPSTPAISAAGSPEERSRYEAVAAGHIANYDADSPGAGKTANQALVAAKRSGNESMVRMAQALVSEAAFDACEKQDSDPFKNEALRDAAVGMSLAAPAPASVEGSPSMEQPADSGGPGSEQYQTMMSSAQNGDRLLASSRQPDGGLVRSTMGVARQALSSARSDNNPAHIAESGALIHRTASMASRLPSSHPDTPSTQMEAADCLMDAASGCEQAAEIHGAYSSDLIHAAHEAPDPQQASQLSHQAEVHFQRQVQLRAQSTAFQGAATSMARTAVQSARVGAAIGGVQRMATLNQVYHRAEPLLSEHGDQPPPELAEPEMITAPPSVPAQQPEQEAVAAGTLPAHPPRFGK